MAKKDNSGFVLPQIVDPPRKCVKIFIPNEVYHRGAFWGAIFELTQAFNWQQNPPEKAREVANLWFDIWSEATKDNNMTTCCDDVQVQVRVNPETGVVEQSNNGGQTWTPQAGGLPSVIVQPVPPVTSGVAGTKCDAATNVSEQVQVWIDQVSNDFTTAESLLAFAEAVLIAILAAVLVVLSAGALTPLEALVLPTLGAALTAAWGAGKAVFDAYWTTDVKDKILCAAYCNIGDDGSYSDAQFSAFWNKINADLPASPAKMLFMGFLSSVGKAGLNAMAASGMSADADCSDCTCGDPCTLPPEGIAEYHTTVTNNHDGTYTVSVDAPHGGDGYLALVSYPIDSECCKIFTFIETTEGVADYANYFTCGDRTQHTWDVSLATPCSVGFDIHFTGPGSATFSMADCP